MFYFKLITEPGTYAVFLSRSTGAVYLSVTSLSPTSTVMLSKKLPSLRYPLTTTRSRSRSRSTALLLLKDAQCTANSLSSARSAIHLPIWEVKQTARSRLRRCWTLVDSRPVFRWSSPDIAVLLLLLLASLGPLGCSGNKAR